MKNLLILQFSLVFLAFFPNFAKSEILNLSQDQVLKLTADQSPEVIKLKALKANQELAFAQTSTLFDLGLTLSVQKEESKFRSVSATSLLSGTGQDMTSLGLTKYFTTGTQIDITGSYQANRFSYDPSATFRTPNYSQSTLKLGVSQNLWNDFFGKSSRAKLLAAEQKLKTASLATEIQFEDTVIKNLNLYWKAVASFKIFEESDISLKRYENLVTQVKRKNSFGTALPGELAQVQAELESKRSAQQLAADTAQSDLETLKTALNLTAASQVRLTPNQAKLPLLKVETKPIEISRLRRFKVLQMNKDTSLATAQASNESAAPSLKAFLQYGAQGLNNESANEIAKFQYPETTVGVTFSTTFGSDLNRKIKRSTEADILSSQTEFNYAVQKLEDQARNLQTDLKTASAIYNSLLLERNFRNRAADEYTRAYNQGRVDIQNLIQVLNSSSNIEAQIAKAQGNFESLLLQWNYFNDL